MHCVNLCDVRLDSSWRVLNWLQYKTSWILLHGKKIVTKIVWTRVLLMRGNFTCFSITANLTQILEFMRLEHRSFTLNERKTSYLYRFDFMREWDKCSELDSRNSPYSKCSKLMLASMELVQLWFKLRAPFVPCPNVPLQCYILDMMLMKYQRWKWAEHSTVVARDSCQKSEWLVQRKHARDETLLVRPRYSNRFIEPEL